MARGVPCSELEARAPQETKANENGASLCSESEGTKLTHRSQNTTPFHSSNYDYPGIILNDFTYQAAQKILSILWGYMSMAP